MHASIMHAVIEKCFEQKFHNFREKMNVTDFL